MRIQVLQHVPFEGPAFIAEWARARDHALAITRLYAGEALPALESFDFLVIMGGPMSVHDVGELPWLKPELELIRTALQAGKKALGLCLGAQMLASVLGGSVTKNARREIGWFPVKRTLELPKAWAARIPQDFMAFHWHGETFSIPPGCVPLGSSNACQNQGFLWRDQVLALQFHLETTEASAEALLTNCAADLQGGGEFVQVTEAIRARTREHAAGSNSLLAKVLDAWV